MSKTMIWGNAVVVPQGKPTCHITSSNPHCFLSNLVPAKEPGEIAEDGLRTWVHHPLERARWLEMGQSPQVTS